MATLGDMGDISNLYKFGWYKWVHFFLKTSAFPFQNEDIGICLGPTNIDGNDMCQWVPQQNGQVFLRITLRRLRLEELILTNETESNKRASFDADIK